MNDRHPQVLLALDASTSRTAVAVGVAGAVRAAATPERGAAPLIDVLRAVLRDAGATVQEVTGIVVGTGPGSFTGLRIALAAAKTLAYARQIPLIGHSTMEALALAATWDAPDTGSERTVAIVQPAGARDQYLGRVSVSGHVARLVDPVALLSSEEALAGMATSGLCVAVDVRDASAQLASASRLGAAAGARLGEALLVLGGARLADGQRDDPATLVPGYVALPRGIPQAALSELTWSSDRR